MAKIDLSGLTKEQIDQLRKDAITKRANNRKAQLKARQAEKKAKAKTMQNGTQNNGLLAENETDPSQSLMLTPPQKMHSSTSLLW